MKVYVLAVALLLTMTSTMAAAETYYVSDVLHVLLRTKPSDNGKPIRTLPSGTALEMLGESSGDFVKVVDPEGDTGWVPKRFLMDNPAAQTLLPGVREKLSACQEQRDATSRSLQGCENNMDQKVRSLKARTRELEATLEESQRQIAGLKQQTKEQADRELREWFATGAAVLAGGVILGLIISAFLKRRRPSAW